MSASYLASIAAGSGPSGATISDDGRYRYALWRRWLVGDGHLVFVMLNPSTADGDQDDPTIRRCSSFARRRGYGGIIVVNLFAYRATDPKVLWTVFDPVGPENHTYVVWAAERATEADSRVVCAWGGLPVKAIEQSQAVLGWLDAAGRKPWCLGRTEKGFPRHPLYVPGCAELMPYEGAPC